MNVFNAFASPRLIQMGLICLALCACADKTPDCANPEVLGRISADLPHQAVTGITSNIDRAGNWERPGADRLRSQLDTFGKSIKVQFKNITSDGFDANARKHSCSADLEVVSIGRQPGTVRIAYSVQGTTDGKDFILRTSDEYQYLLGMLFGAFDEYSVKSNLAQRGNSQAQGCIEAKIAEAKRELDAAMDVEAKQAEKEGYAFRGQSPVQEEEWKEKTLQKATLACQ